MKFKLNSDLPIHNQLIDYFKKAIISGYFQPGSKLLTVRDFSEIFKVNPNTLQKALSVLEENGLIITKSTIGKFITDDIDLIEKLKNDEFNKLIDHIIVSSNELNIDIKTLIERVKDYEK